MEKNREQANTAKSMHAVSGNYPVGATGKSIPDAKKPNNNERTLSHKN